MLPENKRSLLIHLALIGLTALSARFLLLYAIGPQALPDTPQYLEVSRNLAETGTFTALDPATGKLAPFAMRVPLFHVFTAAIMKAAGPDCGWQFAFFNILLSAAIVLLTAVFFRALAGDFAGLLAGYVMALNPNAVYNSVLVLPDTLFSLFVLLAAMAGVRALRGGPAKRYLLWGLAVGLTTMVKPVFKYYWVIPPLLLFCGRAQWKDALKKAAFFVAGFALIVSPWLVRNYVELNFKGFELTFGVNTIWATTDLVKPSTPAQALKDPVLARVRDIVAASGEPMAAMTNVKTRLNMTDQEVNTYLFKIGEETALKNPVKFAYRYVKNAVNFIVSGSSVVEMSYKLLPGGGNYKKAITDSIAATQSLPDSQRFARIIMEAISNKTWPALAINVAARAAFLAFFLFAAAGLRPAFKLDKSGALVILSMITYLTLISAFASGYDRYRLPVDPLMAGLLAVYFNAKREAAAAGTI